MKTIREAIAEAQAPHSEQKSRWNALNQVKWHLRSPIRHRGGGGREERMSQIKSIFLFANGNVAACDDSGQQMPEWQPALLCDYLRKAQEAGVLRADTLINLPNGIEIQAKDFCWNPDL